MRNSALRKHIRKVLNEYGNFATNLSNPYPNGNNKFPDVDKDHPTTPEDLDYWNDLKYQDNDEYSQELEEAEKMEDKTKKLLYQNMSHTEFKNKDYRRFEGIIDYLKAIYPQYKFSGKPAKNQYNNHDEYWIFVEDVVAEKEMLEMIARVKNTGARFTAFNGYCYN